MPRRIGSDGNQHVLAWQDYFDHQMRTMGSLVGRLLGHKIESVVDFPGNLGSEDTWLEYWTGLNYGAYSVKFLGRHPESDVSADYPGVMDFEDYITQLMRWTAEYQKLLDTYPELFSAAIMSWMRMAEPEGWIAQMNQLRQMPAEVPICDRVFAHYLIKLLGKAAKSKAYQRKFGRGSQWESPRTDRLGLAGI